MTTSPFCPQCQRYIGTLSNCPRCNRQRGPIEVPPASGGAFWQTALPGTPANQFAIAQINGQAALIMGWSRRRDAFVQDSGEGGVTAVALASAEILWQTNLRYAIEGGVAVAQAESMVLVGSIKRGTKLGNVVALNLLDGSVLWEDDKIHGVRACPVIEPNSPRAYVIADDGLLHGYDLRSGHSLWRAPVPIFANKPRIQAAPLLVSDNASRLILGSYGNVNKKQPGEIAAVDRHDGKVFWKSEVLGNVRAAPLLAQDKLFVSVFNEYPARGLLMALNLYTGQPIWKQPLVIEQESGNSVPYLTASALYAEGWLYVGSRNHQLYAVDAGDGGVAWQITLPGGITTTPVIYAGTLLVADTRGVVSLIDLQQRRVMAQFKGAQPIATNPLLCDDMLLIGAEDGTITALPWHLGAYSEGAERLLQQGDFDHAGDLFALAAEFAPSPPLQDKAMEAWQRSRSLSKAGYFKLAHHQPAEAATLLKQAALQTESIQPARALDLYRQAAHTLAELRREGESLNECTQAIARLSKQAWIEIQVVNTPTCTIGEKAAITLRVRNKSQLAVAAGMRVYASGALHAPSEAEILVPLASGEQWNVQIPIIATQPESDLILEISHPAGAPVLRMQYLVVCKILGKEPPPNYHFGDVGVLKLSVENPNTHVAIACNNVGAIINKQGSANVAAAGDVGYIGGGG